jgi:hypothetical protein
MDTTITLTFGDCAENHVGMQKTGHLAEKGMNLADLNKVNRKMKKIKAETEIYYLDSYLGIDAPNPDDGGVLLVIRNGINILVADSTDQLFNELVALEWDSKAKMYGSVKNKNARHNLCFSDVNQDPDYENGKGSIIAVSSIKLLEKLHQRICKLVGIDDLVIEGNKYFDSSKCGIGFHGDAERNIVIGCRFGATTPLVYQWYQKSIPISNSLFINLNHGDIYLMSNTATGNNWKQKNIPTLRHSAGCAKYTKSIQPIKNTIKWKNRLVIDSIEMENIINEIRKNMSGTLPLHDKEYRLLKKMAGTRGYEIGHYKSIRNTIAVQKDISFGYQGMSMDKIIKAVKELNISVEKDPENYKSITRKFLINTRLSFPKIMNMVPKITIINEQSMKFVNGLEMRRQKLDKMRQIRAELYEDKLAVFLNNHHTDFLTEKDIIRDKLYDITPDILFKIPIKIIVNNNEYLIHWMDAKMFCLTKTKFIFSKTVKQAEKYNKKFGPGALVFRYGFDVSIKIPETLLLDSSIMFP